MVHYIVNKNRDEETIRSLYKNLVNILQQSTDKVVVLDLEEAISLFDEMESYLPRFGRTEFVVIPKEISSTTTPEDLILELNDKHKSLTRFII